MCSSSILSRFCLSSESVASPAGQAVFKLHSVNEILRKF